jgi:uncharacterized membrane protein
VHALHEHIAKDGFRLRGTNMSRIDAFSDVVFGFALTLIVVSLEVPKTYDQLHQVILGFVPFLICFVLLISVWWTHFQFFRHYGLHDLTTILINSTLLFTLLFYVYPLKFLFTMVAAQATAHAPTHFFSNDYQPRELMIVYGAGFAAIYFCLSALYWNAWRQRLHLRLSPLETTLTLSRLWDEFGVACVGLICCLAARLLPLAQAGNAGWFFFLIPLWKTIHGAVADKHIRAAHAHTLPEDRHQLPPHI